MSISKIGISALLKTNFKAHTTITAPESLLSKENKEYFEEIGAKIGIDSDVIEISVSDLFDSKIDPSVKMYKARKKYSITNDNNVISVDNSIDIPYIKRGELVEKNSPKNYIKNIFDRLLK